MSIFSVGGNLGLALGPVIAIWTISRFGFRSLPLVVVPSLVFTAAIIALKKTVTPPAPARTAVPAARLKAVKGAYTSLVLTVCVVIMRSWIQLGIMAYIPFYFIDVSKGAPYMRESS